jgi:restriction system protein
MAELASLAGLSDSDLAGRVTPIDILHAQEEASLRKGTLRRLEQDQRESRRRFFALQAVAAVATFVAKTRTAASSAPMGRIGCAVISLTVLTAMAVVLVGFFTLNKPTLLLGGIAGLTFGGLLVVVLLFVPSDETLASQEKFCGEEAQGLRVAIDKTLPEIQAAQISYKRAAQVHQRLQTIARSRRHRLLTTEWRMLRGIPFEDFLQEVFEDLGYHIDRTKTSGDQGADLIAIREGVRTAVQAKGYAESVGNGAVQEAHAGMAFYKCHRCAVITNSEFTSSARDLASRINCTLVEGAQIPDLIQGKLRV